MHVLDAHVKRGLLACALVVGIATTLVGCGDEHAAAVRPFPKGDPALVARPPSAQAQVQPPDIDAAIAPGQLFIPAIGVNSNVLSLPTEMQPDPFLGGREVPSFGVPPDMSQVAWWSDGPPIGGPGMAVVLGHSQVGGGYGVFNNLVTLKPGDEINIEDAAGATRVAFKVISIVPGISKKDGNALQQVLSGHPPDARLALITCGGLFDSSVSESEENVIVFAGRV